MSRTSYYVSALDPSSAWYDCGDSSANEGDIEGEWMLRTRDDTERANAWCSRGEDGMHYPCFDVDVPILGDGREALLNALFPNHRRVWSSTTNHFHVYDDGALSWDVYYDRLSKLVEAGVVQEGYLRASSDRGATFVRMPHVKKREAT